MQDTPAGEPHRLCSDQASVEKLELDRLRQDLPKFKPWVSPQSWQHWQEFLDNGMDSFFSEDATDSSEWLLPTLEASAASQPVETAPGDEDGDLAAMFEAEQTPCQVRV